MKTELKDKNDKISEFMKENAELKTKIVSLTQSNSALHWQGMSYAQQNSETLLIGSSLIRDIDESKLLNTKCICIPGGCFSDAKEAVTKLPTTNKMQRIVLVVGGNDCDGGKDNNHDTATADILSKCEALIKCATEVSLSIAVSSICPHSRGDAVLERIRALNADLKVACNDLGVEFIDHDP